MSQLARRGLFGLLALLPALARATPAPLREVSMTIRLEGADAFEAAMLRSVASATGSSYLDVYRDWVATSYATAFDVPPPGWDTLENVR